MTDDDRFYVGPLTAPDKYMLVDCLGAGGEGEVWTAQVELSRQGRRKVAVKILSDKQIGRDDASWQRHADLLLRRVAPAVQEPAAGKVEVARGSGVQRAHRRRRAPRLLGAASEISQSRSPLALFCLLSALTAH